MVYGNGLIKEFRKKNTYQFCREMLFIQASDTDEPQPMTLMQCASLMAPLLKTSKTQIVRDHAAYMDSIIIRARLPYTQASAFALPPMPADPINAVIFPVFDGARMKEVDTKMQDSLLTAVLALRAYQVEHGAFPDDLNALVSGGYLAHVPVDPFSPMGDAPLRYRLQNDGTYLLYSIGPDGKDNNGAPIRAAFANGTSKTWVEADMTGDFVVGVNNIRTETPAVTR